MLLYENQIKNKNLNTIKVVRIYKNFTILKKYLILSQNSNFTLCLSKKQI